MGDQPIPGQDEDIFLGTNLYDFFFLNLIIVRIRSARLPEQRYVRWFYFFLPSSSVLLRGISVCLIVHRNFR